MNHIQTDAPPSKSRPAALGKAWRGLLTFLEIIGLKAETREVDHAAQLARFRLYHTEFRKLGAPSRSPG